MPGLKLRQEILHILRRGCRGSYRFGCLGPFDEPGSGGAIPWSKGKRGQEDQKDQEADDPPWVHGEILCRARFDLKKSK